MRELLPDPPIPIIKNLCLIETMALAPSGESAVANGRQGEASGESSTGSGAVVAILDDSGARQSLRRTRTRDGISLAELELSDDTQGPDEDGESGGSVAGAHVQRASEVAVEAEQGAE